MAAKVCAGRWDEICPSIVSALKDVLPREVKNVAYDLVRDPSRYMESTLRISRIVGKQWGGVCFLPTRRSNMPHHCKVDIEAIAQFFLPTQRGSGNARLRRGQEGVQQLSVEQSVGKGKGGWKAEELWVQVPPRDLYGQSCSHSSLLHNSGEDRNHSTQQES